ncbi:MAG: SpaH/EbpB family LPXTG-anchored major pilin [Oscillospiraceae bacterium]|nr:SpaH/EbpB family LPXTG-anchored major pilin [Oscillospiraceae bacterium]
MKKITRFLSIIPAAVLVLTVVLSTLALAAEIMPMAIPQPEGTYPGSITLTSPDDAVSIEGKKFRIYRIFDAAYNSSASTDQKLAYRIYSEDVRKFLKEQFAMPNATDPELVDAIRTLENKSDANQLELQVFASKLLDVVKESNTVEYVDATSNDAKSYTVSNLKLGYYLIQDTSPTEGENAVIATLELTTTQPSADVMLKLSRPTIEKFFDPIPGLSSWTDDTKDSNSLSIGDSVNYKIVSKIPETRGYDTYNYMITDTLSNGLTLDESSIKVIIAKKESDTVYEQYGKDLVKSTDYSYSKRSMGNNGTYMTFTFGNIKNYPTGYYIIVTYSATLNANAVVGETGNSNTVYLEYSNNPSDGESKTSTPPQTVKSYTFALDITKAVAGAHDYVLEGAKFKLYRTGTNESDGTPKQYVKLNNNKVSGWTTGTGDDADAAVIVTNSSGKAMISGIEEGTYFLEETEAPPGYNKLKSPIKIVITATYDNDGDGSIKSLTATIDGQLQEAMKEDPKNGINKNSTIPIMVENAGGPPLPETGGVGTTVIYVIGAILAVGAAILLVAKKRMSSTKS